MVKKWHYHQGSLPMHHPGSCFISTENLVFPELKTTPFLVELQKLKEMFRFYFKPSKWFLKQKIQWTIILSKLWRISGATKKHCEGLMKLVDRMFTNDKLSKQNSRQISRWKKPISLMLRGKLIFFYFIPPESCTTQLESCCQTRWKRGKIVAKILPYFSDSKISECIC